MAKTDTGLKRIVLPLAANDDLTKYITGQSLLVVSVTGAIQIAPEEQGWSDLETGDGFQDFPFTKVRFRETAGSAASVTFLYGVGKVDYRRLIITGGVVINLGDTIRTPALVATTGAIAELLLAADSTRNGVYVANEHATDNMYVGDANIGNDAAKRGRIVEAGNEKFFSGGAALYFRRAAGNNVTARLTEHLD